LGAETYEEVVERGKRLGGEDGLKWGSVGSVLEEKVRTSKAVEESFEKGDGGVRGGFEVGKEDLLFRQFSENSFTNE
jgi:hypothetical protein